MNYNIPDQPCESNKCSSEINQKNNKNTSKKSKKCVDSLLEKLENYSKNQDNLVSKETIGYGKKIPETVKSTSPDFCKSRSPSEDDVVSPNLSNDDSNDLKQKRKRKLGIPLRLSKEYKLAQDHSETEGKTPLIKLKSNLLKYSFTHELSTYIQQKLITKQNISSYNEVEYFNTCYNDNACIKETSVTKDKNITDILDMNESDKNIKFEEKDSATMSQYLLDNLKNTQYTKSRRSSECLTNFCKVNKKIRRRSCNDLRELFFESTPKISITNETSTFHEVESQLEQMFAGIIEIDKNVQKQNYFKTDKLALKAIDNEKSNFSKHESIFEKKPSNLVLNTKNKKKTKNLLKIRSNKRIKNMVNNGNQSIDIKNEKRSQLIHRKSLNNKVSKKKNYNMNLHDIGYEASSNTTTKNKGPIIQIKGIGNIPKNVQIVNDPREDDEEKNKEKRKICSSMTIGRIKANYQNNLDYRGKICNIGLFSSTLSMRYDAHTADESWICIFCKRGPHFLVSQKSTKILSSLCTLQPLSENCRTIPTVLSDLFGPYLIDKSLIDDKVSYSVDQDILIKTKGCDRNKLRYLVPVDKFSSKNLTKNGEDLPPNIHNFDSGMTVSCENNQSCEVWLHEQCIIWTAGVFISGGRINGLQDAIWDSAKTICDTCGLTGANIGCIKRGCKSVVHYCCALASGWLLDFNQFLTKCNVHEKI